MVVAVLVLAPVVVLVLVLLGDGGTGAGLAQHALADPQRILILLLAVSVRSVLQRMFFRLGLATNQFAVILVDESTGERIVLWDRDERLALQPHEIPEDAIDGATSSGDVDKSKPAPDLVEVALDKAGVPAEQAVFVGGPVEPHRGFILHEVEAAVPREVARPPAPFGVAPLFYGGVADVLHGPAVLVELPPLLDPVAARVGDERRKRLHARRYRDGGDDRGGWGTTSDVRTVGERRAR